LQENVKFWSSMCIFWMRGDHHSIGLLVKQHNMPETSLTKESAGNAPCVPTTSWRNWTNLMEISLNKIKWFGWYGCSWSEEGGDTMPSALKCLIEWVFLFQKFYFYFKLCFIFSINHFSYIKLYMHYNGLYIVQWCKWCWSYVWHLWKCPMNHHILYWPLNPKNAELGDEGHFQQEKKWNTF
jgi:hypothetical protein